jgi:two-component system, OmpR family, sensor histidine kinase MprB
LTLRRRLTLLAAGAVAVAVCLAALGAYLAVRSELRGQVDEALEQRTGFVADAAAARSEVANPFAQELAQVPGDVPPGPLAIGSVDAVQAISPTGAVLPTPRSTARLPISDADALIASGGEGRRLADVEVDGRPMRVLTASLGDAGAVQFASSLEGVDDVLADLRVILVLLCLGGIGLAALGARILSQQVIAPIEGLTEAADHVTATEDLSRRITVDREDEVGRLATRFNAMLGTIEGSQEALTRSLTAQSQLVADASHELRTPIASLRTDVESLIAHPELSSEDRNRRLVDVEARIEELTALVNDVIELARGDAPAEGVEEVRLDELAAGSVAWMNRHVPERRIELAAEPTVVDGRPERVARAINNLLDNAHKYSPAGEPIEVSVAAGAVRVRDHGPGIDEAEITHVFDRFWRGAGSREVAGSGLGLAIVRQVAESHGGSVAAAPAEGGGTEFVLSLGGHEAPQN